MLNTEHLVPGTNFNFFTFNIESKLSNQNVTIICNYFSAASKNAILFTLTPYTASMEGKRLVKVTCSLPASSPPLLRLPPGSEPPPSSVSELSVSDTSGESSSVLVVEL